MSNETTILLEKMYLNTRYNGTNWTNRTNINGRGKRVSGVGVNGLFIFKIEHEQSRISLYVCRCYVKFEKKKYGYKTEKNVHRNTFLPSYIWRSFPFLLEWMKQMRNACAHKNGILEIFVSCIPHFILRQRWRTI